MGSFGVACGISHANIDYGDRAGFLLLTNRDHYSRKINDSGATFSVNICEYFDALYTPVFGVYDDYGHLTNIEENYTTRHVESVFGKPIKEIIKMVGNGQRALYDHSAPIWENYFGVGKDGVFNEPLREKFRDLARNLGGNAAQIGEILELLGFDREEEEDESEMVAYVSKNDKQRNKARIFLVAFENTDSDRVRMVASALTKDYSTIEEKTFSRATELLNWMSKFSYYPGYGSIGGNLYDLSRSSGMFFATDVFEAMRERADEWKDGMFGVSDTFNEEYAAFRSVVESQFQEEGTRNDESKNLLHDFALEKEFSKITGLRKLAESHTTMERLRAHSIYENHGSFHDELKDVAELVAMLEATNNYLQPSILGSQHGIEEAEIALAEIVKSRAQRKIAKRDEDYDEDE